MEDLTRTRLLEAAGKAFAEQGFEGASVRDICSAAQANIAAVNYHFGDKSRLYIETVKHACDSAAVKFPLPNWPAAMPRSDCLAFFIRTMMHRLMDDSQATWRTQLIMRELAQPTEACWEWIREYVRPLADTLRQLLGEIFPEDTSEEKLYLVGFSIMGQCLYYRQNRPIVGNLLGESRYQKIPIDALADHIIHFSLAALGMQAPLLSSHNKNIKSKHRPTSSARKKNQRVVGGKP